MPIRSPAPPSLARRALLAVALMLGFYLLAISIAGALLAAALWLVAQGRHVPGTLLAFLIGGGLSILWAILPRRDRFAAPGPELAPEEHPRLFERLRKIALASGQPMPDRVYLVPDVNAWVARRGGLMGFGSRPLMGLGLPLLASLTVAEMEAVVAHEFGHFHGGDTRLGPWVYKTRAAIQRTIEQLRGRNRGVLQGPFVWYGNFFLRLTHGVSRTQEHAADALAARIVGARSLATGLEKTAAAAMAYDAFLNQELGPAVDAGFRMPMAEGFVRFVGASSVAVSLQRALETRKREEQPSPYDTHPPLRERLAALGPAPEAGTGDSGDPAPDPAIGLLDRLGEMESRLLGRMLPSGAAGKLRPLAWEAALAEVWIPAWRRAREKHSSVLAERTPVGFPSDRKELLEVGRKMVSDLQAGDEPAIRYATRVLGAAFALALVEDGWSLRTAPGEDVTASKGVACVEPFLAVVDCAAGGAVREQRIEALRRAGLEELRLGAPSAAPRIQAEQHPDPGAA